MPSRDPVSVAYDRQARRVILQAMRQSPPRIVKFWLASPNAQFANLDKSGRTANERAFMRSVYYQVWRVPINAGVTPKWSARFTWGHIERRGGRIGRQVQLRLYLYRNARNHVDRRVPAARQWRDDIEGGNTRSIQGARVDENRRAPGGNT